MNRTPHPIKTPAPARFHVSIGIIAALTAFWLETAVVHGNIEPAQDINAVIPLKPSQPTGQFPKQGDDERLAPNYTFTVDVQITEQEQIGQAIWNRVGPVKATTQTPDPNLFWTAVANTTIYHLTNTAQTTGLATLDVTCRWQRQAAGGAGAGAVASIDGRAGAVIELLDSVVHWEFGDKVIAPADGNQVLTFAYKVLDEAGRGLERWDASGYLPDDPDPGHVGWHFLENALTEEWEREVEVTSWEEAARAEIRLDYNDGSHQVRVSEEQSLTFFTAELKVVADGEEDAQKVTLGKSLKLTAEFVPADFETERIRFSSSFQHEHSFHVLHDSDDNGEFAHDDHARIAGKFNLRHVIHYHNGAVVSVHVSDIKALEVQFPSYGEIVVDQDAVDHFHSLWQDTLDYTIDNRRREYGCWVKYDSVNLTYILENVPPGPDRENHQGAYIHFGPVPVDDPDLTTLAPNAAGAVYTVANFHTHTPTRYTVDPISGEQSGYVRPVGASEGDNTNADGRKLPGVVYDYSAFPEPSTESVPLGYGIYEPGELYRSGTYERRSTPELH